MMTVVLQSTCRSYAPGPNARAHYAIIFLRCYRPRIVLEYEAGS